MSQQSLFGSAAESSSSSQGDSRAPTSPLPGRAPGSTASSPDSGARCSASSEMSFHLGRSLRTFLRFALAGRSRWSLIWRKRAIPSCHLWWWVLGRLEPLTGEIESGSLPGEWATPRTSDAERGRDGRRGPESRRQGGPCLMEQLLEWPTPTARDWRSTQASPETHARNARPLSEAVGLRDWPTPTAADADRASEKYARGNPLRGAAAREWPTPRANDPEKRGNFDTANRRNGLPAAVGQDGQPDAESGSGHGSPREWCTPTRRDEKGPGPKHTKGGRDLAKDAAGKLNPDWVEALMGAPPGWTNLPDEAVSGLWATRTRRTSRS